ncbi:hypothetical protein AB0L53_54765 [Nonomuraea sp. NPDC052129]|uniref:hypothetical protein n=1 Tax=Nonomuraea sp. NPDC052129 TaxID=3154651 RepID=UPI0034185648
MNVYATDLPARIRNLEREVADLRAQARPALTEASQGWRLKSMTPPAVGAGEAHIGADASGFFATDINGTKRMMYKASNVDPVSGAAGDTYGAATGTLINLLITRFNELIANLIGAQHMDP